MKRLRSSGTIFAIDPSGSVDVLRQITDLVRSVQGDLSSVITEYNAEVYSVLGTLPQGVEDNRWQLTSSINPRVHGLDGANILVDISASAEADGGKFWYIGAIASRPKTIKESLLAIYTELSNSVDSLRLEVGTSSSTGVSDAAQARIGINIFDGSQTSASDSLDSLTTLNQRNLSQVSKDVYDVDNASWTGDGSALLTYSHKDHLAALVNIHSGAYDSDITLDHTDIYADFSIGESYLDMANNTTITQLVAPVETQVGRQMFDGTKVVSGQTPVFRAAWDASVTPGAPVSYVRLYDIGPKGGPIEPDVLVTEFSSSIGDFRYNSQNLTVSSDGPTTNTIKNAARIYSLRVYQTGGTGDTLTIDGAGISAEATSVPSASAITIYDVWAYLGGGV